MLTVYPVPLSRPVTVALRAVAGRDTVLLRVLPPLKTRSAYPVTADPPSPAGGLQVAESVAAPGVTVPRAGTSGGGPPARAPASRPAGRPWACRTPVAGVLCAPTGSTSVAG